MIQSGISHESTKYRRNRLPDVPGGSSPPGGKHYPAACPRIDLPRPARLPEASFWQTVARRRSVRRYTEAMIGTEELFLLLWAAQGITQEGRLALRAAPSAGARYPLETYVAVTRVDGIEPGLYHWELPEQRLALLGRDEAVGRRAAAACLGQAMCAEAACVVMWTAVFERTLSKYGERGMRYVYLDAGHAGQNLQLAATALGLGSCNIGALFDDEMNALLGVDGQAESIVYVTTVGPIA